MSFFKEVKNEEGEKLSNSPRQKSAFFTSNWRITFSSRDLSYLKLEKNGILENEIKIKHINEREVGKIKIELTIGIKMTGKY